jgi:GNAT superfamily N-acetyltransferase
VRSEVIGIGERFKKGKIGVKEIMCTLNMTLEDQFKESEPLFPHEVFEGLDELIDRTVHGTKIEYIKPEQKLKPFQTLEIHTEREEVLGYLNMIYFRNPISCYYLVYVEVLPPFRGRGLGNKILRSFREFVEEKGAMGLLDNIIPPNEPTYGIYTKLGWRGIDEVIGEKVYGEGNYMVFIPSSLRIPGLREKLIKLLFRIKKKRSIIDIHDNESMVKQTLSEFQAVYETLEHLFEIELFTGTPTPFMRFMFTKFTTKLLGFRRRITTLLGYTGGESLEQIVLSERIKDLPILPYSLWSAEERGAEIWGDEEIIRNLPEDLRKEPTFYIEALPLYRRPYLVSWTGERRDEDFLNLKISHLLELGFDPTRLREFHHRGMDYIFERVSPHFLSSIERKSKFFQKIAEGSSEFRFRNASIQINAPLVILRDRGNVYILRRKVEGIHLEEALDQLRAALHLKEMNRAAGIDRAVMATINEIREWLKKKLDTSLREEIEELAFFVPWNLQRNIPLVSVDITRVSLDTVWIA